MGDSRDMTERPAHELAHHILARELSPGDPITAVMVAQAAERAFQRLSDNLMRWVGAEGTHALFTRALTLAQAQNPALRTVPPPARSALFLDEFAKAHDGDARAVTEGVVLILTALIELLSRLVGNDLAVRLVRETAPGRAARGAHIPGTEHTS